MPYHQRLGLCTDGPYTHPAMGLQSPTSQQLPVIFLSLLVALQIRTLDIRQDQEVSHLIFIKLNKQTGQAFASRPATLKSIRKTLMATYE